MAITRYTQPAQAQYVPMDMNSYQMLANAKVKSSEQPMNFIASIMQKQEQNYNTANAMQDQLEMGLAGIRAINPNDQILLNKKKQLYQEEIKKAVDRTGGNPASLLPYLTNINRQFKLDVIGGDLSGIKTRYDVGMEDLKQAKKDLSLGRLDPLSFKLQTQLLGTGVMVPRSGDIDKSAKDMLIKTFKDSDLSGDKRAIYNTYLRSMISKYSAVYNSLDDNGKEMFIKRISTPFELYYRDVAYKNEPVIKENGATKVGDHMQNVLMGPYKPEFNKDGSIKGDKGSMWDIETNRGYNALGPKFVPKAEQEETQKQLNSLGVSSSRKVTANETLAKLNSSAKKLNLPDDLTDEQKYEIIKRVGDKYSEVSSKIFKLPDNKNYRQFSLLDEKGKLKSLSGETVEIRKGDGSWEKVDKNDPTGKIYDLFGNTPEKALKQLSKQNTTGGVTMRGSESGPAIIYNLTDKDNNPIQIRVTTNDYHIKSKLAFPYEISRNIENGNINEPVKTMPKPLEIINKDGKPERIVYNKYKIINYYPRTDANGNKIPGYEAAKYSHFVLIPLDKDGNPIKTYSNGKEHVAMMDPNNVFLKAFDEVKKNRRK